MRIFKNEKALSAACWAEPAPWCWFQSEALDCVCLSCVKVMTDCWEIREAPGFRSQPCLQEYTQRYFLPLNAIRNRFFKIPPIATKPPEQFGLRDVASWYFLSFWSNKQFSWYENTQLHGHTGTMAGNNYVDSLLHWKGKFLKIRGLQGPSDYCGSLDVIFNYLTTLFFSFFFLGIA